jgi:hypothetical protein
MGNCKAQLKRGAVLLLGIAMIFTAFVATQPAKAAENGARTQAVIGGGGETWKYLDDNSDPFKSTELFKQATVAGYESAVNTYRNFWALPETYMYELGGQGGQQNLGFDDTAWKEGQGPFAYKNTGTAAAYPGHKTELAGNKAGGTDKDGPRIEAYFFRYSFDLSGDMSWVKSVNITADFDDAILIRLNGAKIFAYNMPDNEDAFGGLDSNVAYSGTSSNEKGTYSVNIDAGLLLSGTNTLAVQLHQSDAGSSDIYLDVKSVVFSSEEVPLPPMVPEITNVTVSPGRNETELNFAWLSNVTEGEGQLDIWTSGEAKKTYTAEGALLSKKNKPYPYYTYKLTATNLKANTTYNYQITNTSPSAVAGTEAYKIESKVYTVKTGAPNGNYTFLLVGDPQIGASGSVGNDNDGWTKTIKNALLAFPNAAFIVSAGDQVETADTETHYDGYLIEELRGIAVAPTVGNHDNSANYRGHFNVPNLDNGKGETSAGGDYFYTYGGVLFMHINSNNLSAAGHKAFMEEAIAANPNASWKIVVFHHSIYSSASHTTDNDIRQRRAEWSPIFSALNIDAALAGHDHVYTRSKVMGGEMIGGTAGNGTKPIEDGGGASYTKTKAGETVYITANSASGSKYYALTQTDYDFVAKQDQASRPTVTKIDVSDGSLTFNTYYTDEAIDATKPVDTFALRTGNGEGGGGGGGGGVTPTQTNPDKEKPAETPAETGTRPADTTDASASRFSDAQGHWAYAAIDFVVSKGLFNGVSSESFAPNAAMTRAMFATVLSRYANGTAKGTASFGDVPAGRWYSNGVLWAAENGVVSGMGNNLFDPNGSVTREQLVVMLRNYAKNIGLDVGASGGLSAYADTASVSAWATDAFAWAVSAGLITGKPGNLLDAKGTATRAEVAVVLQRFAQIAS